MSSEKEKDDSIPDLLNLDYSGNGSPINQQLTKLWQMVGQMIFGIIGSGEVFNHSNNISLINDNLNQIRRVIEMESQPETQFHSFVDEQRTSEDFNIATAVAGSGIGNSVRQHNALDPVSSSQNPPHNQLSSKQIQTDATQTKPTSPRTNTHDYSTHRGALSIDSFTQCQTESIFKKPASKTKRKLATDDCTIRKRICQRKMTPTRRSSQMDDSKPKSSIQHKDSSCVFEAASTSNDRVKQSTSPIDEPDASLVENILRFFKMPNFIEPITDPPHILEAINRLSKAEKSTKNIHIPEVTDFPAIVPTTVDSESKDSMSVALPTHSQSDDLKSPDVSMELSTYDEFESPASPPPSTTTSYQAPIIIPTSPKKLNSLVVEGILANFDKNKRTSLRQRKLKVPTVEEEQIITSTRSRIEQYVVAEWNGNEIDTCCKDLSTVRPSVLSKCILEVVTNTNSEPLSKEFTPPAPSLPRTHQKIVVLIKRISRTVNGFEDLVLFQLEKTMFVLGDEQVTIAGGLNLTHLFIGLTACADAESNGSCVLFVYKCLYYFSIKAIPMIYSVLMAYPTILPKFDDGEKVADFLRNTTNILQATFVIILINTNLSESNLIDSGNSLRKRDLSTYLKTYYHYPCMRPTIDDFVDILLDRLTNSCNLGNIPYSLILIAKRNGTVWADHMVQRKLLPKLNQFLSTISDGTANDERIAVLVSAISSIIKTYPITKDISGYQQLFHKILDSTTRQTIQEEAVMALLRTSRFGMVDVYKQICDWRPQTAVRRQCYLMLNTFLYRQNLSYWQNF
ncbi:uncharacterized protein LOC119070240 isoform X1 [Bradysia coprophila]|uniref:uncharacterized protein LOC119070240 isoform X1 n=1 Tax=Bradysia coprophila TaxID=38358 RepID=UPI00187DB93E|nr:uncharacterized protein LOC119070240 isoform X1 [Bradysia coprophila]